MNESTHEFEKGEELYGEPTLLGDYVNELSKVFITDSGVELFGEIDSVEERYAKRGNVVTTPATLEIIKTHPKKVERINKVATLLNSAKDVLIAKQACNEIQRLVQGGNVELMYPEPEANPDLLEM